MEDKDFHCLFVSKIEDTESSFHAWHVGATDHVYSYPVHDYVFNGVQFGYLEKLKKSLEIWFT